MKPSRGKSPWVERKNSRAKIERRNWGTPREFAGRFSRMRPAGIESVAKSLDVARPAFPDYIELCEPVHEAKAFIGQRKHPLAAGIFFEDHLRRCHNP
jgi:hypothetical protein